MNAYELFDSRVFPAFLLTLKTEKTKHSYMNIKNRIELLCGKPFLELTKQDGAYFINLLSAELSNNSLYTNISYIKSIANFTQRTAGEYLHGTKYASYTNPFCNFASDLAPSAFISENKVPSVKEINVFLKKCNDHVLLACSLILKCGLSSSQLTELTVKDLVTDNGLHYIHVGSHENRYVYVPDDAFSIINSYIFKHGIAQGEYIFSNSVGARMSLRVLQKIYKKETEKYGFPYTMQDLRNTAATYMLAGGAGKQDVCSLLGITDIWGNKYDKCISKARTSTASEYSMLNISNSII
jgi:integrase